jgi:hypothetical protein
MKRVLKGFGLLLLCSGWLPAAISNVRVLGATATQAVLAYTAPSTEACGVEVSESPGYSPLVHDVNAALFAGANLDSRVGSVNTGQGRIFVAGKRTAELAGNNRKMSRALQANTVHYYRITCGPEVATGTFQTTNIPQGSVYNDAFPADPNTPGEYAWPDFDQTARSELPGRVSTETVVEPQTGLLFKRLTLPQDMVPTASVSSNFTKAIDLGGAGEWTDPAYLLADDANSAVYSGTGGSWLYLGFDSFGSPNDAGFAYPRSSIDWFQVTIKGHCSGTGCNTASAEDRTIEICLTQDRLSCSTQTLQQVLTDSMATYTVPATKTPIMWDWTLPGKHPFGRYEMYTRTGKVNVSGTEVTWVSGSSYFSTAWAAGSKIAINGVQHTVSSVESPLHLTVASAPGDGTNLDYTANNFGALIRKKTSSPHEISLQFAQTRHNTSTGAYYWSASAATEDCSRVLVNGGYNCVMSDNLYWVNATTGETRLLASMMIPPAERWNLTACGCPATYAEAIWDTSSANSWYCIVSDKNTGRNRLLKGTYSGDYSSVAQLVYGTSPTVSYIDLTAAKDLELQIQEFSQSHSMQQIYDPDYFSCQLLKGAYQTYLAIWCPTFQDGLGWYAVFDTSVNRIAGAASSYANPWPGRWAGTHSLFAWNDTPWMTMSASAMLGASASKGMGPYRSKVEAGIPMCTVDVDCNVCPDRPLDSPIPAGQWPSGRKKCTTVTVDGEPCDIDPYTYSAGTIAVANGSNDVTLSGGSWSLYGTRLPSIYFDGKYYGWTKVDSTHATISPAYEGAAGYNGSYTLYAEGNVNHPKCGTPGGHYLQDAMPRDNFREDTSTRREIFRLLIKNGNSWVLERKFGRDGTSSHPGPCYLWAIAGGAAVNDATAANSAGTVLWSYLTDPDGQRLLDDPTYHIAHQAMNNGYWTVVMGVNSTYWVRRGSAPPDFIADPGYHIAADPVFGTPASTFFVGSGSHVGQNQVGASAYEKQWALDARPFEGGGDYGSGADKVAGTDQVYKVNLSKRLSPKILPTLAACGRHTLRDISGPGSTITDAKPYTYCYANAAGECVAGSSPGQVYVSCPYVSNRDGTGGKPACASLYPNPELVDICMGDLRPYTGVMTQLGLNAPDRFGDRQRMLTKSFTWWRTQGSFWNLKGLTDASWLYMRVDWLSGARNEVLLLKNPGWPSLDSVNRRTFVPIQVSVAPPASLGVASAVIEFGYDPYFYCTSRQEACVANASAINESTPFYWSSETFSGLPCGSGCSIAIPAIPQRTLYYRVHYRGAAGEGIATGQTQVVAVP